MGYPTLLNGIRISGGYNHDYSTAERIIGTWIDGKALYEKVFDFGVLPNTTLKSVDSGITGIDKIIRVNGFAETSGVTINVPYIEATSSTSKQTIDIWYNKTTNKVEVNTNFNASSFYGYIIVQYTKTNS